MLSGLPQNCPAAVRHKKNLLSTLVESALQ